MSYSWAINNDSLEMTVGQVYRKYDNGDGVLTKQEISSIMNGIKAKVAFCELSDETINEVMTRLDTDHDKKITQKELSSDYYISKLLKQGYNLDNITLEHLCDFAEELDSADSEKKTKVQTNSKKEVQNSEPKSFLQLLWGCVKTTAKQMYKRCSDAYEWVVDKTTSAVDWMSEKASAFWNYISN